jgi:hypothetical protein
MSGGRAFDPERQKALVHYIVQQLGSVSRLKLRSMLYLIDLEAYRQLGKTITGATYRKGKQTVIVEGLSRTLRELRKEGAIE